MITCAHVFIYGDVTGVGFRKWTLREARSKQLTGWVRNSEAVYPERSRRVEAIFEGEKENIEEMIKLCNKGPEVSWVEKVDVKWEEVSGEFVDFNIVH